jgi:hypothetical protein
MRAAQFRGDGSRVVGRQVIDGRVAARVRVVRRVVDDAEHEQVHQAQVQQQEAETERQETQIVGTSERMPYCTRHRLHGAYFLPVWFDTMAMVVFSTMRSATDSSCNFRCASRWEN